VQEAAASGVKVLHAKRVLKLAQALEAALASSEGGAGERHLLVRQRYEAAEAGGVAQGPLLESARRAMSRLLAQCARDALDAALKPHSDWSVAQRIGALKDALDKAEGVLHAAGLPMPVDEPAPQAAAGPGSGSGKAGGAGSGAAPKLANGRQGSKGKRTSGSDSARSSVEGSGREARASEDGVGASGSGAMSRAASGTPPSSGSAGAAAAGASGAEPGGTPVVDDELLLGVSTRA
jgi:hypothetical protein